MCFHSGEAHLKSALRYLKSKVVVLLGSRALAAGMGMKLVPENHGKLILRNYAKTSSYDSDYEFGTVRTFVTYWPTRRIGTDRYENHLKPTLKNALKLHPRVHVSA